MIRINLLPDEYRRRSRTSPKVFAAVLVSVMVVCGTVGWFGYVYFGELGFAEAARTEAEERLSSRTERVVYYDQLVKEQSDYEVRAKTIGEIAGSRVLWTEVVDQMIDTVNNDGDIDRHMSWFSSIRVTDGDKSKGPSVQMPGWVQGDELQKLAHFHEDLEQSPFYQWVNSKSLPSGVVHRQKEKRPEESLSFTLEWKFKPANEWNTER